MFLAADVRSSRLGRILSGGGSTTDYGLAAALSINVLYCHFHFYMMVVVVVVVLSKYAALSWVIHVIMLCQPLPS